jgi:hypothetical protein
MILYKLGRHPSMGDLMIREFLVTHQTRRYMWIAPINIANKDAEKYSVKIQKKLINSEYFDSPKKAKEHRGKHLIKEIEAARNLIEKNQQKLIELVRLDMG